MIPTKQEILELDKWIAETLFMFYVHREGQVYYISQFKTPDWNKKAGVLPLYATDPAAAMEVLKKCGEKCNTTVEFTSRNSTGQPQWMVSRLNPELECEDLCECSKTIELAIALFAKKLFSK